MNRYNLKFKRNDKKKVKAVCKKKCSWTVWVTKKNAIDFDDPTWKIKTFVLEHRCFKDMKNRNMTSKWMGRHYL